MSANLGSAHGSVLLSVAEAIRGLQQVRSQLLALESAGNEAGSGLQSVGRSLDDFARSAGVIGAALTGISGVAAKTFGNFEQQINTLGAVTGVAGKELQSLSDLALDIGQSTSAGATEAAQGLTELAKAGVDTQDVLEGAGRAAVLLSEAGGIGVARAAELMATSLNIFNLAGKDAAHVADVFAAAANKSAADVSDLAQAMEQVGNVANQFGLSLEDTAGALALFADAGLKGSDAGTALKTALLRMLAPVGEGANKMDELGLSFRDAQGDFVGLAGAADRLRAVLDPLTKAQRDAALAAIFGQDAIRVGAILYDEGGAAVREYVDAVNDTGAANDVASARMRGMNGALERMRGSIETAAIAFGGQLAPTIERGAGLVEGLADAFSALPGPVQQAAAGFIGVAGALALVAAGTAKATSFAIETIGTFKRMTDAVRNSQRAMSLLALSPVGLALAGIAFATYKVIEAHRRHKEAADNLKQAYRELTAQLNEFRLAGDPGRAAANEAAIASIQAATTWVDKYVDSLEEASLHHFDTIYDPASTADDVSRAQAEYARLMTEIDRMSGSTEQLTAAVDGVNRAFADSRVDAVKLQSYIEDLGAQFSQGKIGADEYYGALANLPNITAQFAADAKAATDATQDQAQAFDESAQAAEEARKAQERFNQQVAETVQGTLNALAGIEDIGTEIDGVQAGFGRAGDSLERLVWRMDTLGHVSLSGTERQALRLVERLHQVDRAIERVTASIENNQGDMSMWSGRIDLVTSAFGGNADALGEWIEKLEKGEITQAQFNAGIASGEVLGNFEKLDALYNSGAISLAEYNEAKEAANFLIQRSAGGIQDERVELTKDIVALAEYVRLHDDANGAVEGMTDAQRGFIAALQSSNGLLALQTLQLLVYLAAMGAIPEEKVTQYILDASAADPVVGALFRDLELIPDEKTTNITVTGDTSAASEVGDAVNNLPKKVKMDFEFTTSGDGTDLVSGAGLAAFLKTIPVKTELQAPDTSAVDNATPATKTIPTKYDAPSTAALTEIAPPTVVIPTRYEKPSTAILTEIAPPTVTVSTKLDAPNTAALDDYVPPTITIPTQFGTPTGDPGKTEGATGVVIPTSLGVPDTSAISNLSLLPVLVETVLGSPDDTNVTGYEASVVMVPTAFGAPDVTALVAPDGVITIPTQYGIPTWPTGGEGAAVAGPDPITIPVKLGPIPAIPEQEQPDPIVVAIGADDTGFTDTLNSVVEDGTVFDQDTFTTNLAADPTRFNETLSAADTAGLDFENDVYTTRLDADATNFYNDLLGVRDAAQTFANSTYTTTLDANIQPALNKLQELGDNLPSSPAKTGPLSKTPDFDYVAESFARSADRMIALAQAAGNGMTDAFGGVGGSTFAGMSASPSRRFLNQPTAATRNGGGNTTIVLALTEGDFVRALEKAEKGEAAYDWISRDNE